MIGFVRQFENDTILVVLNTSASEKHPLIETGKLGLNNAELEPLYGSTSATVKEGMIIDLRIDGNSGLILKVR